MIERNLPAASCDEFDLVIVGGGVYGVAICLEAVQRGLKPVLLERDDFGAATSWNSLRIVHGGLRYLQSLDLHRFRESVAERRRWIVDFPDLVRPLPCLMPLYGDGMHRPIVLRAALKLNDTLSAGRNRGVAPDRALRSGRVLSAAETVERFPLVRGDGLKGAALWYDGFMPDSQRLIMEMLHWACAGGAVALNYVEACSLLRRGDVVEGVVARDLESNRELEFRAPVVVNCAGPWCRELATVFDRDLPELFHPSIAFNALLDRQPLSDAALAVAPAAPGGRTYFVVPWKGRILAGTYHAAWNGDRADGRVEPAMLDRFLEDLNSAVPGLDLIRDDVLRLHWGFLPALQAGTETLAAREVIRHHADLGGPPGLFSVSGVKFTTARLVSEKVLRAIQGWRGRPPGGGPGISRPEPVSRIPAARLEETLREAPGKVAEEISRLIADESAIHLGDLLLRRTDWGWNPRRGREIGPVIAKLAGWDAERIAAELGRYPGGEE